MKFLTRLIGQKNKSQEDKEESNPEHEKINDFEINLQGGSFVQIDTDMDKEEIRNLIEQNSLIEVNKDDGKSYDFYTDKVERIYFHGSFYSEKDEVNVVK